MMKNSAPAWLVGAADYVIEAWPHEPTADHPAKQRALLDRWHEMDERMRKWVTWSIAHDIEFALSDRVAAAKAA